MIADKTKTHLELYASVCSDLNKSKTHLFTEHKPKYRKKVKNKKQKKNQKICDDEKQFKNLHRRLIISNISQLFVKLMKRTKQNEPVRSSAH